MLHPALQNLQNSFYPSVLNRIDDDLLTQAGLELWVKRDDLLHPVISGNKWRKLKYILNDALYTGAKTLISMGGAYSNHLHALAYVGRALGLKTKGLIRGEVPPVFNPTLADLQRWDMALEFVSRTAYRELRTYRGKTDLPGLQPSQYWLPEGGAQPLALQGVAELAQEIAISYDVLCMPCGTGATLAGLIKQVPAAVQVLGFAALKHADFLANDIKNLVPDGPENWRIYLDYHFGGFAKTQPELLSFIKDFTLKTTIALEPVYTGKMFYGLYDLIKQGYFQPGQRIVAVHTGGLQGNRGYHHA